MNLHQLIPYFILYSYAVGWVLVAINARNRYTLDLCQFVRSFLIAPFFGILAGVVVIVSFVVILPNILGIFKVILMIFAACATLGLIGYFIVTPAVKKAVGVAKPFSDKICVTVYRRKF